MRNSLRNGHALEYEPGPQRRIAGHAGTAAGLETGRLAVSQPMGGAEPLPFISQAAGLPAPSVLQGKRVAMVTFSPYPFDPRPRRAADALLREGMNIDLFCMKDEKAPTQEVLNGINVFRLPVTNHRGGKLAYIYQYSAFILLAAIMVWLRALRHRYDLVYVHNMPDILVVSALLPKLLGAKVILDLHDPMPELMTTIFAVEERSLSVRVIKALEKWSIARANLVLTVNLACREIFSRRSCSPGKIGVVMNSPIEEIFSFQAASESDRARRVDNQSFVIMYHGSIVERNGLALAIDALERVKDTVPGAELRIYGSKTAFLDQVMDKVRDKGLSDYVHYFGPKSLEQLSREIEGCDVGIIPNPRNAFTEINTPTRIFEYLAKGKPVIAPRTSGIENYFGQQSLLFFEPGSADDLARNIEYVSGHRDETLAITKRAQEVYLAHTWSQERQTLVNLVSGLFRGQTT